MFRAHGLNPGHANVQVGPASAGHLCRGFRCLHGLPALRELAIELRLGGGEVPSPMGPLPPQLTAFRLRGWVADPPGAGVAVGEVEPLGLLLKGNGSGFRA